MSTNAAEQSSRGAYVPPRNVYARWAGEIEDPMDLENAISELHEAVA